MATIIRIGDEYVNLDNVMSISIRGREVCLHRIEKGEPIKEHYEEEEK